MSQDECCNPPDNCEMNRTEYVSNKIIVGKCSIKKSSSERPGSGGKGYKMNRENWKQIVKIADFHRIAWSHTAVCNGLALQLKE